ncbi:NAD(P)-dependent oxidoreductase [candidate division KSB1 bacterium]|nr:NAD(P)-dependent oxidoreductase [candidate division KSB1 bacterium]RQW01146.1 MAG: NAD(P)-dependent oxidoreductase [candidate division KSB1 bacterium]
MIGLNKELEQRKDNPVKVGLVGCGQMGIDVVATTSKMNGLKICIVADIDQQRARSAYQLGRIEGVVVKADTAAEADQAVADGKLVYTTDYRVVTDMQSLNVMLEATGVPEIGARAALRSAQHGQHLAMMNVETDITVGPLLNWYAKKKGVLYAMAAGDEPAACKELYDFAISCGFTIVAAGKGKNNPLDRYAKPTDDNWAREAARRGLGPNMLIEFIDGSKTMIEMACTSNATGLVPDVRGMHGPVTHREILNKTFALKEHGGIINKIGVVDYGIGGVHPGVFIIVTTDHPRLHQALVYRDMGNGPYYTLFRPYHLCSIEVPLTCAMLAIRTQANMEPLDRLVSEVFAVAKQDLKPGDQLDGIGGSTFYSLIDTYECAKNERLLPIGLAKHARLIRAVRKDTPITYDDVTLYEPSTVLDLRRLQDQWISGDIDGGDLVFTIDRLLTN